jgi:hypothetical protein
VFAKVKIFATAILGRKSGLLRDRGRSLKAVIIEGNGHEIQEVEAEI